MVVCKTKTMPRTQNKMSMNRHKANTNASNHLNFNRIAFVKWTLLWLDALSFSHLTTRTFNIHARNLSSHFIQHFIVFNGILHFISFIVCCLASPEHIITLDFQCKLIYFFAFLSLCRTLNDLQQRKKKKIVIVYRFLGDFIMRF